MRGRKIYAAIFALIIAGLAVAVSFNNRGRAVAAPPSSATELLGMLPASDAVAFVDTGRMLSEVVPHIFAADSATLAHINREFDKFQSETGTDPRQIEAVAVGMRFNKASQPESVMGFVRGRFDASQAITAGIAKAKGRTQLKEEQYEGTTIYVVERKGGFGLAAFDANTIAFGDIEGIRAALDVRAGHGAKADSSLIELATLNASAVAGFAANVPASAAQQIIGSGETGKAFASVNRVYGSADATGTTGTVTVALRSETSEQAQALAEKLGSLKQIASIYLSQNASQRGSNAQTGTLSAVPGDVNQAQAVASDLPIPPKWVKDLSITAEGNDVKLRLEEPLSDLASIFRLR